MRSRKDILSDKTTLGKEVKPCSKFPQIAEVQCQKSDCQVKRQVDVMRPTNLTQVEAKLQLFKSIIDTTLIDFSI